MWLKLIASIVSLLGYVLPYYVGYMRAKEQKELDRLAAQAKKHLKVQKKLEDIERLNADDVRERLLSKWGR